MNPIVYTYICNNEEISVTLMPVSRQLFSQVAHRTAEQEGVCPSNDALSQALEETLHRIALMHAMQQQGSSHQALMEYLTGHVPLSNEWLNHTN